MKRAIGLLAALAVLAMVPGRAEAQRGRGNSNTITPYGTFSRAEMDAAGNDVQMAAQFRQQQQMMQQQMQMMKQQEQYDKQMAAQKKQYDEYIKKHPEAAKADPKTSVRKAAKKKGATKAAKADTKPAPGGTIVKDEAKDKAVVDEEGKPVAPATVAAAPTEAKAAAAKVKSPGKIEAARRP